MTNVTISISTSLIFRSLVVIFQLRPPMASLFSRLYICPGLLFVLMLYPEGDKLLEQRYVKEGLKSSLRKFFMVDTGILSNNMKFLSQMLNNIL